LCDYDWEDGRGTAISGNDYHTEHVLEWQVVTDFFRKLNETMPRKYTHPDTKIPKSKKVDFCTYWYESWNLDSDEKFSMAISGSAPLTPWEHIAAAYPSTSNNPDELVALQANINSGPKSSVSLSFNLWAVCC
jgi:hypothetical protein